MQEIIEKLKTKELELKDVMSRDLFFLCCYYWKAQNNVALQACRKEAEDRLKRKGYQYLQGKGWMTK